MFYNASKRVKFCFHKLFRKPENGFDHIISLGYNCEVAFRFLKWFKFEESSLFNWAASDTLDALIGALENIDNIGQDGFRLVNALWKCNKTNIYFHGRQRMRFYLEHQDTEQTRYQDMTELMSRIQYLKQKFIKIAQSDDTKLYIYKLHSTQITDDIHNNILRLHRALTDCVHARNFRLLIVHERGMVQLPTNPDYIIRTVKCFAPDAHVTSGRHMNNGWDSIFYEFYPKRTIKRNKTYKFDTRNGHF